MDLFERAKRQADHERLEVHWNPTCLVCGEAAPAGALGVAREHEYESTTRVEFPVVRCPRCGLVFLNPRPAESALRLLYPPQYYAYHMPAEDPQRRGWLQNRIHQRNVALLRGRVEPFVILPEGRPLRVLDIGCGTGRTLGMLREIFLEMEGHGVDLQESAIEAIRRQGHAGYVGRFEELDLPSAHFDLIVSLHVIEHVARPDRFIERCRDLLAERGTIMIETPDTDSLGFRLFQKRHWGGYHAPRHWYLFDRQSLRHLAGRVDLEVVGSGNYAIAAFPFWTLHSLAIGLFGRRLSNLLFPPVSFIHGGLVPTLLLTGLSLTQQALLGATGRSSAQWIALGHSSAGAPASTSEWSVLGADVEPERYSR